MPSVFTLEGPDLGALGAPHRRPEPGILSASGSGMTIVNYPSYGTPLAPAGDPIGPARPETPVFGPGGTPVPYRRHYPARGPVCDYCDPQYVALGDATDFLNRQSPGAQNAIVVGGTMLAGVFLGGFAVWLRRYVMRKQYEKRGRRD
jgi:hypothetical protein